MNDVMDVRHAREVLEGIESGQFHVATSSWSNVPSPLAHNVVLLGISDIVLMEDRSALLRELHRQVLKKVVPEEQLRAIQFTEEQVSDHFRRKHPRVSNKEDILPLLKEAGSLNLLQQKGRNLYDHCDVDVDVVREWSEELIRDGRVVSVWTPKGVLWCTAEDAPTLAAVYARRSRLRDMDKAILTMLKQRERTAKDLTTELKVSRVDLNDGLRRLERGYRIRRLGLTEPAYGLREVEETSFESSVDDLALRLLGFVGPMTLDELS